MYQWMRCFISLDTKSLSSKRILDARSPSSLRRASRFTPDMLETVHEIGVYLHRFHNLDLFQQGWYQVKISAELEDQEGSVCGIPSRVVQYEAPDLTSDDILGVWRIDDVEQSFYTQPFRIKYARQDVPLSILVSFNLSLGRHESPSSSAVMLKFELMYAPILEHKFEMEDSFDGYPVATHEFRIPPKALLGLHSYCPVFFDAFHAVLVDLSIHTVFLKAGTYTPSQKVTSNSHMVEDVGDESFKDPSQVLNQGVASKAIELVKSLLISRGILLGELNRISKAVGQQVDDLIDVDITSLRPNLSTANEDREMKLPKSYNIADFANDVMLYSLSKDELLDVFMAVGKQLSYIWNAFLKFHRINKNKLLEHLRDCWASDRKTEWSIWMVHSKIEIPHRYLRSRPEDSANRNSHGKVSVSRKSNEDPAQSAIVRAELHRKSIAQMKINNWGIQDMQIFGDPSRVPVLLIEQHVMNVPLRGSGYSSSIDTSDQNYSAMAPTGSEEKPLPKLLGISSKRNGRLLKVVVFVHGFQGHHLDLRLVRNQWLLIDPGAECLMSEANEDKTSGDFRDMGNRLAEEVTTFIRKKVDKLSKYGGCRDIKLSFVGHSIGNIIIRTALTVSTMRPFLKHLYTYMSLSGPHLGYWYSSNSLFNSGLWLLKKLKGAQCIHQLTFSDDSDLQKTFIYMLCKQKTLENFKNIILLSSPQDGYVPYHSARIELCPASSWDHSKKADVFTEMLNNCLDQIRAPSSQQRLFMRCDVNFDTSSQGKNLNTIIGRAAHIEFLETDNFARFIMWSFPDLFQ